MATRNRYSTLACVTHSVFVGLFFPLGTVINEQFYAFHLVRVWCNRGVFWNLDSEPVAGSTQGLSPSP